MNKLDREYSCQSVIVTFRTKALSNLISGMADDDADR